MPPLFHVFRAAIEPLSGVKLKSKSTIMAVLLSFAICLLFVFSGLITANGDQLPLGEIGQQGDKLDLIYE